MADSSKKMEIHFAIIFCPDFVNNGPTTRKNDLNVSNLHHHNHTEAVIDLIWSNKQILR